jgi:hypothetical protein
MQLSRVDIKYLKFSDLNESTVTCGELPGDGWMTQVAERVPG